MARRTVSDWLKVESENPIALRIASAKFKLADLGSRGGVGLRAVYLAGPPGVGKTHSIIEQEEIWKAQGLKPMRLRPQNARELIDFFAAAEGISPLIMEEADVVFRSKPMFEVLKQATDPLTPDFLTRITKIKGQKIAQQINLNVPIVVSTNMDLTADTGWDKNLIADRDALFNRSSPIVIPNDAVSLWEWSVYLAFRSDLTRYVAVRNPAGGRPLQQAIALDVQAAAIQWFTNNINKLLVIAPRSLKQVAQLIGRTHHNDMPESVLSVELNNLLGPPREHTVPVPKEADWAALLKAMPKQIGKPN